LKDKIPESSAELPVPAGPGGTDLEECRYKDALTALIHLGYKRNEVKEIIQGLASEGEERTVEELIRESLRLLSTA
ncbi:MAG: RuvA C-terminal domain-containing protein, partial [bacterium]|nr:RuvA C-terminal domain-containing protein [bacterium]